MDEAAAAAQKVDANMEGLRSAAEQAAVGQLDYNDAAGQFVNQSGQFVSQQQAQAELFDQLRAAGVKTEAMYEEQISTLSTLQEAVEEGSLAHRQLTDMQDRLQREMLQTAEASEQASGGFSAMSGPGAELGFILQDMQQFQFGVSEGIRSISNNIPGLIQGFQGAAASGASFTTMMAGTGGLIIAVNAAAAALPFLIDELTAAEDAARGAGEEADKATQNFQQLADRAIEVGGREGLNFEIPAGRLEEAASFVESRVQALRSIRDVIPEGGGMIPGRQFEQLGPLAQSIVQDINAQNEGLVLQQDLVETRLDAAQGLSKSLSEQLQTEQERKALLRELNLLEGQQAETVTQTAENLQSARQDVSDLRSQYRSLRTPQGVALAQARRTKQQLEGQVEALRNVNRILARRQDGIQVAQVEAAPQNLEEAAVSAENLSKAMEDVNESIREFNQETDQTSDNTEDAGDNINDNINNQIARGIQLSAQLGSTLVQSARQGGLSFKQAFSSILQTVGQVLALSGNPIAGAALSGTGAFVGAFQEGGRVPRSGMALVGEAGPELVNLPAGSEVHSNQETQEVMTPPRNRMTLQHEHNLSLERIGPGQLGVILREVESYQSKHPPR